MKNSSIIARNSLVGAIGAATLLGLISLFSPSFLGGKEWQLTGTALMLAGYSLGVMALSVGGWRRLEALTWLGAGAGTLATAVELIIIWSDKLHPDGLYKAGAISFVVFAAICGTKMITSLSFSGLFGRFVSLVALASGWALSWSIILEIAVEEFDAVSWTTYAAMLILFCGSFVCSIVLSLWESTKKAEKDRPSEDFWIEIDAKRGDLSREEYLRSLGD